MTITTTPKVEGAWAWIQHDDGLWALDWRPKGYWPANTKVHVDANVYGMKFGDGAYGSDEVTSDFRSGVTRSCTRTPRASRSSSSRAARR